MLLAVGQSYFCFSAIGLVADLIVSLAIGSVVSIALKVAVGLLK